MNIPSTRSELSVAERVILTNQLRIFKVRLYPTFRPHVFDSFQFFLQVLRDPEAVRYLEKQQPLRGAEVQPQDAGPQATMNQVVTDRPDPDTRGPEAEPEADGEHPDEVYEGIVPRAALYTGTVKGFGDWKVNVTDNANSQLRKLRKKSPETLRLVMTKIKRVFHTYLPSSLEDLSHHNRHVGTSRMATFRQTVKFSSLTPRTRCRFSRPMFQGTLA